MKALTVGLILIVGLTFLLRFYRLDVPALSNDEAFSWRLTEYAGPQLTQQIANDVHPPLYYWLLNGWVGVLGDSPAALRGMSVLFGVLSVVVVYALCREAARLTNQAAVARGGALFAAFLVAVHAAGVQQSQNARMYALGMFLAGLSAWLLLRALRAERGRELYSTTR